VRARSGAAFANLSAIVAKTHVPSVKDATYSAGTTARTAYVDTSQKAADSATWALLVFAAAAALVGAIVVGQAVLRHLAGASSAKILAQLGMTCTDTARVFTIPVFGAATIGAIGGAILAVLASPLLPIGLARRAEVEPGIRIEPLILVGTATLAVALVAAFAFLAARQIFANSRDNPSLRQQTPAAVRAAKRAGASPVVDIGIRFAAQRRVGARTFPVRTVFAGVAVAVASVAAAGLVSASYTRLADRPARSGWNWSSEPDYFGSDAPSVIEQRLVPDKRIAGVGELANASVRVEGMETSGWAMRSLKGNMAMTLRRGRLPADADEIALGEDTMARSNAHLGEQVRVATRDAPTSHSFRVVGTVVFRSQSERPVLGDGAAFTPDGLVSLVHDKTNLQSSLELRYPPNTNVPAVEAALTKQYGLEFNAFTEPQVPGVVRHLSETRTVAIALALFFALLGTLALAHAVVVGTGRRRLQLAVFRALGFRPAQVRGTITVQAVALGLAAVVVGLPSGIVLGRFVWHVSTNGLGARDEPATPWIVIVTAIPLTVLWATVLAAWPAWRASRTGVAESLRVE
jgi:putative ABC transport system permease protein